MCFQENRRKGRDREESYIIVNNKKADYLVIYSFMDRERERDVDDGNECID